MRQAVIKSLLVYMALLGSRVFAQDLSTVQISKGLIAVPLLTPASMDKNGLKPNGHFDVQDGRVLVIQSRRSLYDLGSGKVLAKSTPALLEDFAIGPGGLLLTISGRKLGYVRNNHVREVVSLPYSGMRVSIDDAGRLYLYGGKTSRHVIYLVDGDRYKLLAELSEPVSDLAAAGGDIYVASGNSILKLRPGQKPNLVFSSVSVPEIQSLAVDRKDRRLFFSGGEKVYVLHNGITKPMIEGLGGRLRYSAGMLFILSAEKKLLLRISGLEQWRDRGQVYSEMEVRRLGRETLVLQKAYLDELSEAKKKGGSTEGVKYLRELIDMHTTRLNEAVVRRKEGAR